MISMITNQQTHCMHTILWKIVICKLKWENLKSVLIRKVWDHSGKDESSQKLRLYTTHILFYKKKIRQIFKASAHTDFAALLSPLQPPLNIQFLAKNTLMRERGRGAWVLFSLISWVFSQPKWAKGTGKCHSTPTPSIWSLHNRLPVAPLFDILSHFWQFLSNSI